MSRVCNFVGDELSCRSAPRQQSGLEYSRERERVNHSFNDECAICVRYGVTLR